jgi:quercetin dioxygenase-like cupin family protein
MNRLSALAIVIALLSGVVAGELHALLTAPAPIAVDLEPHAAYVADAFYEGMNQVLEKGDPSLMETILDSSYTDHSLSSGTGSSAADLEAWLAALARSFPGIRVQATSAPIQDGWIVSTLILDTRSLKPENPLMLTLDAPRTMHDLLRIEQNRVVERWSAPPVDRIDWLSPVGQADFAATSNARQLALERITLPPQARLEVPNVNGAVLLAESGSAELGLRTYEGDWSATPATRFRLQPGEMNAIPAGQPFWIGNTQLEPAVLLMLSLRTTDPMSQRPPDPTARPDGDLVSRQLLTFGPAFSRIENAVHFEIAQIVLEAGTSIAPHNVQEAELVLAIDGEVEAIVDAGNVGVLMEGGTMSRQASSHRLQPGEALIAYADSEMSYRPAGGSLSTMLVITISSAR